MKKQFILSLAAAALAAAPLCAENLRAVQVGTRIDVWVGGQFFTSYRFDDNEKYPFFYPVNGPSGASVTSMRNGEYPHHSSLFFGCDRVNGGNYWQEGLERGRIISESVTLEKAAGPEVVIAQTCVWRRPDAPEPFSDTRRIVITAPAKELRIIDFDVTLEAKEAVEIQKTNHSLFSARVDPDLNVPNGGALVNAEGAKGEKETFGKGSPWMAFYGRRGSGGASEGLAIFQHPANPWYPSPWFTRDYGFLSPTPMFWPADGQSTKLAQGEKLVLRYRTVVFAGDPESAKLKELFEAYAK
ncbi:MAG: PmoA family protein [Verrucomicrobiota bacterium]|jgi:hypothetical protein|nr:PmoA family protein [Verrucomicrobiota bacterium]